MRLHTVYFKLSVYVHIIFYKQHDTQTYHTITEPHVPTPPILHNTCEISCPPHLTSYLPTVYSPHMLSKAAY